jgi:hypothetical protein
LLSLRFCKGFRFEYYLAIVNSSENRVLAREFVMAEPEINGAKKPRCGPESNFKGKAGRSGPPKGSRNHLRHGFYAGKLPPNCLYIEHQLRSLRRQLEDAVIAARGEVSILDAANIQTAIRWEQHIALARRWLRIRGDKLKPMEQLQMSREMAKGSSERDKALAALKLDRDTHEDLVIHLYGDRSSLLPRPPKPEEHAEQGGTEQ